MEELFGVPTQQLLWILLAVFGAGALILGLSALRNRVSFRMAARNLPRRRTQTILVVLGLMLATMLFSASFTTGIPDQLPPPTVPGEPGPGRRSGAGRRRRRLRPAAVRGNNLRTCRLLRR